MKNTPSPFKFLDAYGEVDYDVFFGREEEVEELYNGLRLRWICKKMGFERVSIKLNKLRAFFTRHQQSAFYESNYFKSFLSYVSKYSVEDKITLKQTQQFLIVIKPGITSLQHAYSFLTELKEKVQKENIVTPSESN